MLLSNKLYDRLKWVVLVLLPATAVLINGLTGLFHWHNGEQWATLINLITVFLGSLLQISSNNFHQNGGSAHAIITKIA